MEPDTFWSALLSFARNNETFIELFLFLLGFAESLVVVSIFVPASGLFLGVAALEAAAGNPVLPIILAGAAGCFFGDMLSYLIGASVKDGLSKAWPFTRYPLWLPRTRELFERRGVLAIFVSKFVGPLRPVVPFVAGASQMSIVVFASASAASSLVWSSAFLAPGYYGIKWLLG